MRALVLLVALLPAFAQPVRIASDPRCRADEHRLPLGSIDLAYDQTGTTLTAEVSLEPDRDCELRRYCAPGFIDAHRMNLKPLTVKWHTRPLP